LEERKEKDSLYTHAGVYKLKLESLMDNQKTLSEKEAEIKKLQANEPSLRTSVEEATKNAEMAKQAVDKQQAAIDQLTKERNELNPTQISIDIEQANKRINALDVLRTDMERLEQDKKETEALKEKIRKDEKQFEILKGKKEKAEAPLVSRRRMGGGVDGNGCKQLRRKESFEKITKKPLGFRFCWKHRGFSRLGTLLGRGGLEGFLSNPS
jgi:chromosome segregation ATPase